MKKFYYQMSIALMGVVIGVMLSVLVIRVQENKNAKRNWEYGNWRKLSLVLDYVNKHYVDTIDVKKVSDAAIEAALNALDPHSTYLPPVELEESETELAGNFDGIGIQFNVPNDTAIVLSVISGGPSEKVGLCQGDRILKVDEKVIAGMKTPQDSMVRLMKGPSGTKVKITVQRGDEVVAFDITRGKIPVNCVDASFMIDEKTGDFIISNEKIVNYSTDQKISWNLYETALGMSSVADWNIDVSDADREILLRLCSIYYKTILGIDTTGKSEREKRIIEVLYRRIYSLILDDMEKKEYEQYLLKL